MACVQHSLVAPDTVYNRNVMLHGMVFHASVKGQMTTEICDSMVTPLMYGFKKS